MLAASYWPKDRVIINRLDSVCQAVLKGKWPGIRRVYEPGSAVASFYTTKLMETVNSPSEDPSASPQGSKQEGGLKLTFQKQGLAVKRPLDTEEGPQAQQQYLARLQELQNASDTGLTDFSKPQYSFQNVSASVPSHLRMNGVVEEQPMLKKRRGRRKNVEGMDLLFMNQNRVAPSLEQAPPGWGGIGQVGLPAASLPGYSQSSADTESRVPVINLKDGTRLAGDDAPKRRDLDQWLKEHPGFVTDTGAFIPSVNKMQMQFHFQDGRPKQKRHRCRNPNKIDVNSLTGEERVQIINRRNARKIGGAFAPPLKDLARFLQENPEYGVPPEWADVVKQSGYLPENMFDRILTGPIVPEEVSRRGRRPKNPLARAAALTKPTTSSLGVRPLMSNGLLPGVDLGSLQAFQQNLHSLQSLQLTAGLMGLPADASNLAANNLAAMFPMMLSGVTGLPNLLSVGGLLGKEATAGTEEQVKGNPSALAEQSGSKLPLLSVDNKGERTEASNASPPSSNSTSPASNNSLSLNPLLLSSMIYPGMLLTPGLNLSVSAAQPQSATTDPAPTAASAAPQDVPQTAALKDTVDKVEEAIEETEDADEDEEEFTEQKDNSGPEGSGKAESSSSESGSSSSSDDSDSSDED